MSSNTIAGHARTPEEITQALETILALAQRGEIKSLSMLRRNKDGTEEVYRFGQDEPDDAPQ